MLGDSISTRRRGSKARSSKRSLIPTTIAPFSHKVEQESFSFILPQKSHKARCEKLLKLSGLESQDINFLWVVKNQHTPSNSALARLAAIEEILKFHERTCRYCNRNAEIISEFAYHCDRCGDCLNLQWGGESNA